MRRALITTTIHRPDNLRDWAAQLSDEDGDLIVVAGDRRTPHLEVERLLDELDCDAVYLHPDDESPHESARVIGYDTIQRRNLALLEVLRDFDYVITVDDDNYPDENWIRRVDELLGDHALSVEEVTSPSGWWNPGDLCRPPVIHRGYPLDQRMTHPEPQTLGVRTVSATAETVAAPIGVFASLWLGDPDIDAVERIVRDPVVTDVAVATGRAAAVGTWAPFNSQATAYRRELAPLMMMWPGCGRYDDIWASYAARVVMDSIGWLVFYGRPVVRQSRNPHDVIADMRAEMLGYQYTPRLVETLRLIAHQLQSVVVRGADVGVVPVVERLRFVYAQLVNYCEFLPAQTLRAFPAWLSDLERLEIK